MVSITRGLWSSTIYNMLILIHHHGVGKLPFFVDGLLKHRDLPKVKLKLIAGYRGKPKSLQSQANILITGSYFFLAVNIISDQCPIYALILPSSYECAKFHSLNSSHWQEVCQYGANWWLKASGDTSQGKELPLKYTGDRMVSTLSCLIEKYLSYIIIKPRKLFYLKAKQ